MTHDEPPRRALILVDHGSRLAEANAVVVETARQVQAKLGAGCEVRYAHMELAEPTLEQAIEAAVRAGVSEVFVQRFFLVPGRHASEDIPKLVEDARRRHPDVRFSLGEVLGPDPLLTELVLARARLR